MRFFFSIVFELLNCATRAGEKGLGSSVSTLQVVTPWKGGKCSSLRVGASWLVGRSVGWPHPELDRLGLGLSIGPD